MYGDPKLNSLEEQVECANQNLKAAIARYDEAYAAVCVARSAYFPNVTGVFNASRSQDSGTVANKVAVPLFNDFTAAANFNYELDVFGRVRNMVAAARSQARASAADVAVIDLALHTELAMDYFAIRADDAAQRVLDETVIAYKQALYLTQQRYKGGAAPIEDVDNAETQYETAKTKAADNRLKRSQLEHAIAVLIGKTPETFTLKPELPKTKIVTIAPTLPSTLLERRPDIAEAEEYVMAANANIGVARAAFFPDFNLTGGIGYESQSLAKLFRGPSLIWAMGPNILSSLLNTGALPLATQTIFDGGKLIGLSKEACAKYYETVANYRQSVLVAYKQVEDYLVAIHQLDQERKTQTAATSASERALTQAFYLYKGGLTTYLDVVVIQNIALQNELNSITVNARRQIASVQLIKALGGGWQDNLNCLA
jgi:NodT family efflux transporter outer membrane factor (OMF) lipoprotein